MATAVPASRGDAPRVAAREEERQLGIASFPPSIRQNPYQRLLYEALADAGCSLDPTGELRARWLVSARHRVQVLHFHWPHGYYRWIEHGKVVNFVLSWARLAAFAVRLRVARALGYRIVWTIHQVYPHDRPRRIDRLAARVLAHASTFLTAHDAATARHAHDELGVDGRVAVIPHGSYVGVYPPGQPPLEVRRRHGIAPEAFVFLAFGNIRGYKNLELLLQAFRLVDRRDVVLLVAGTPMDASVSAALAAAAAADARIRPVLGYLPDEGVAELFGACDAAVVSRTDGGTSGALVLALSLGLPVVAADTEAYADLLANGEAGWLFARDDAQSLARALTIAAQSRQLARAKGARGLELVSRLEWSDIGHAFARLVRGGAR
jgi:glycosyltransferase involved in cell wall biosynthesis